MKRIFLLACTFLGICFADAQTLNIDKIEAAQLVQDNITKIGITENELINTHIASTYKNKFAGTVMVYLQQTCKGIPIYNQLKSLAFKNGVLVSASGNFIQNVEKYIDKKDGVSNIIPAEAVLSAIADRKLTAKAVPTVLNINNGEKKIEFGNMGVSQTNITAQLMWFASESGKQKVRLGWQVYIEQNTSSDLWLVNISAVDRSTISVSNLTVYCNWDDPNEKNHLHHNQINKPSIVTNNYLNKNNLFDFSKTNAQQKPFSPLIVNGATYRIVPYPAESPIHPGGAPALVTNPWALSGAVNNATTLKWHSVGVTNYDITRGNNVWAQEDRDGSNTTPGVPVVSTTSPDPLNFDFVPDFTVTPVQTTPIQNQQFNVTNLFYWNNIIHDLTYQYGFDEAARNFQGDNMGRGGNGGDFVLADAQDGGGTNNANFGTPADGSSGRMQMYLWTGVTPNRDGDVDNGIISHEYAHGISNRLTGNGSSCLGNGEQMGEGWSDYYGLMYTQNWATSNLNTGFNSPRGIGTYAINQPITGGGIRSQKYCTDFSINNRVYATTISAQVHNRGEIWCATLWDMTWGIINQVGSINPNLFNATAAGGNSIALKLVTEGMKLQPCSPGFISGRDGILQADQILYNGAYRCTILEAFRRRGMGLGASEGSSGSVTDQIPSFTNGAATLRLLQAGITAVPEGQNINYTNRVTTDVCAGFTGFTLNDTLPLNVTYVSGGTYNAANRVVSFPVTQAAGLTIDYNFVVNINAGTYFAPITLLNEPVPATMPSTWTAATTVPAAGNLWVVSTLQSASAPNAFFTTNETISTDKRLELTTGIALQADPSTYPKLSFKHKFDTEDGWDGGVVEISTNGGTTWTDLGANTLTNPYNGSLGAGTGNNLSNRAAYTGLIPTFINTAIKLNSFAGQNAKIRFRFASDDNTAGAGANTGWFVDDIILTDTASVSMRSSLFNASNTKVTSADTVTKIIQNAVVTTPIISTQPSNTSVCAGGTASFTVIASGATLTYSWQVSTNAGGTWTTVTPAATTATLTLTAVTAGISNNRYRVVVTNGAGSATSIGAILTVTATATAPTVTTPIAYCQGASAIALNAGGTNLLWYASAIGGSGATAAPIPATTTVGSTMYYVSQNNGCESPRSLITVNVNTTPTAPTVNATVVYCQGTTASALSATGTNILWYTNPTTGTGNTAAPIPSTGAVGSTNYYVSQTAGNCESPRALITVTINTTPPAPSVVTPVGYCQGNTASALIASGSNLTWYNSPTGGAAFATAPIPATTTTGATTYYVSQTTGSCEGPRAALVVNINTTPAAPAVTSPINYCQGVTASPLTSTGINLLWYTVATAGTGNSTAIIPSTTTAGSINYYVSQSATAGGCEGPRATIIVNVTTAPAITTQPKDITSCTTTASFTVLATGSSLTYQWYVSTDGGTTYNLIASATAATYTINGLSISQSNYKYRVVVSSGACTPITSNSVTAKVGYNPVIVLTAAPVANFNPYINGGLYTTVSPVGNYTYQWKRNNNIIANTSTSLTRVNGLLEDFGSYVVTVTDIATGCAGISNAVTVSDVEGARGNLFISPNPTQSIIKISYYSATAAVQARTVMVYDNKGTRVMSKALNFSALRYGTAEVDLSNLADGTYLIVLLDANGNKLASEKVIKH